MNQEIVVTGFGVICSIGNNASECLQSLRNKQAGIDKIKYLQTKHKNNFRLGEVKNSNEKLLNTLGLKTENKQLYSRTTLLAMIAAKEALQMATLNNCEKKRTGLISATTVGGMDITEQNFLKNNKNKEYLHTHHCADSTKKVAKFLNINGYCTTLNTACSSGANAIIHGAKLLKHNILDRVVVGGADALTMFTLNGFNSLMILDADDCKPFDINRKGLNLGEGAGYIVLERKSDTDYLCSLKGFANANDAYHQTASSPEGQGAFKSMLEALEMSKLSASDINYINVHGTGTANNDSSEAVALNRLFGKGKVPCFSSTKSYTGHTLAAAAGIEAVFSVLSIKNDIIYPNLRFSEPIENTDLIPNLEVIEGIGVNNVMSNSFGFGGNNSTIIFSK